MPRSLPKLLPLIILSFYTLFTQANLNIKSTPIAGGIVVIDLPKFARPKAFFGSTPLYLQTIEQATQTHYQALIGIPLLTQSGTKQIKIIEAGQTYYQDFLINNHQYQSQYITFTGKKKKYIKPSLSEIKRINRERKILTQARTTMSGQLLGNGLFSLPATGVISSPFGLKRYYNNQAKRPHTGIDYAADIGTPVNAPAGGKVILVGDFFYNGKAVFLDHGQGLISVFIHLSKIIAQQGQVLKRGDLLGEVGQTGRATGHHLHWTVYLNTTAINPDLLLGQTLNDD